MGAVGGEVGFGGERPGFGFNGGIAEEGVAGIDAEGVAGSLSSSEGARKGGLAVVRAGVIGEVAAFAVDVVGDAAARCRCGVIEDGLAGLLTSMICKPLLPSAIKAVLPSAERVTPQQVPVVS